jgi:menaquinone-dependent protoporphyrinogen oxidase
MTSKILIVYGSKCGSTAEVAQTMGDVLGQRGFSVDVKSAKSVASLDGYHAVIAGSAIRYGQWLGEATNFLKQHQARLRQIPVAFFTVHALNVDDSGASRQAREAYTAPIRQVVTPVSEAFFAGKFEFAKLSFLEKTIAKAVKAEEGDPRDWDKIRAWAVEAVTKLSVE